MELNEEYKKFQDVSIKTDIKLNDNQKSVLEKLVEASRVLKRPFLIQAYAGNLKIQKELESSNDPETKLKLKLFNHHLGPFNRVNHNKPLWGDYKKPLGANFYPSDMTKEEFQKHVETHPEDKRLFESEQSIIRRDDNGKLIAIPYSTFFKEDLEKVSSLLKEAAELCENESVKKYLLTRAQDFLRDDNYEGDVAWMDMKDNLLEPMIGSYENYEDGLFGLKTCFEAAISVKHVEESEKLAKISDYLIDLEKSLPIEDKHKNFNRGSSSPMVVVDLVYSEGDAGAGIHCTAFNLPNDERVREAKGSKKVMLKNIARAKFDYCWTPLVEMLVDEESRKKVSFDGYYYHVLMHEIAHGLGPGVITKDGKKTSVVKELGDLYTVLEEAKADVVGVYISDLLAEKDFITKDLVEKLCHSSISGIFRSIRFGINRAHGGSNIIQFNYLLEKGGISLTEKNQIHIDYETSKKVLKNLATELLMLQANGDYDAGKAFVDKYRFMSDSMKTMLDSVKHVPIDIRPKFEEF